MIMRTLFLTAALCGLLACSDNSASSGQGTATEMAEAEQLGKGDGPRVPLQAVACHVCNGARVVLPVLHQYAP